MEDADENDVTRDINTPFDGVRNPLSKNNSLYTRWFIGYMTSIVELGFKRPLTMKDVNFWGIPVEDNAHTSAAEFDVHWQDIMNEMQGSNKDMRGKAPTLEGNDVAVLDLHDPSVDLRESSVLVSFRLPVVRALWRCSGIGPRFRHGLFWLAFSLTCTLWSPSLIKLVMNFIVREDANGNPDGSIWEGLGLVLALSVMQFFRRLITMYSLAIVMRAGSITRATLMTKIYDKAFLLSSSSQKKITRGKTLSMMSNDCNRICQALYMFNFCWWALVLIFAILLLLCVELGLAGLSGAVVMLIALRVQLTMARGLAHNSWLMLSSTDTRVKLVGEIMRSIRVIKLYAWEHSFRTSVMDARHVELRQVFVCLLLKFFSLVMLFLWPGFVAFSCIMTYYAIGHTLDTTLVVIILAYTNELSLPMVVLPMSLNGIAEAMGCLNRINAYLLLEELCPIAKIQCRSGTTGERDEKVLTSSPPPPPPLPPAFTSAPAGAESLTTFVPVASISTATSDCVLSYDPACEVVLDLLADSTSPAAACQDDCVQIRNGEFRWDTCSATASATPTLAGIELTVKRGSLVAIVGRVGTGKTSLLAAMLGEMHASKGTVVMIDGRTASVAQSPWVRCESVAENITSNALLSSNSEQTDGGLRDSDREAKSELGERASSLFYDDVLDAASLKADIDHLPHGDQTQIGERGVTLSGGQKARVALARAVYQRAVTDIYLLDDPLSAVDNVVGQHMFNKCILGLLAGKTRVMVMNSHLHLLPYFDKIIVLDRAVETLPGDDCVVGSGTVVAAGTYAEIKLSYPGLVNAHNHEQHSATVDSEKGASIVPKSVAHDATSVLSNTLAPTPTVKGEEDGKNMEETTRLLTVEKKEVGAVKRKIFLQYFDAACNGHGLLFGVLILAIYAAGQICLIFTSVWAGWWAGSKSMTYEKNSSDPFKNSDNSFYAIRFALLVLLTTLITVTRSVIAAYASLRSSNKLHDEKFEKVLSAPVPTYFDVTPVGRIMNRFTQDIFEVDMILPEKLAQFLQIFCQCSSVMVLTIITSYWMILVFIPCLFIFRYLSRKFRPASRDFKRCLAMSASPIFSLFGETLEGSSSIRSFGWQNLYRGHVRRLINTNEAAFFGFNLTGRWLALRLDILVVSILFCVGTLIVLGRDTVEPTLAGLCLIVTLQLTGFLQWLVRISVETENSMTSVERLNSLSEIEAEGLCTLMSAPEQDKTEYTTSRALCNMSVQPALPVSADWPSQGSIAFHNLRIAYRPGLDEVLRGMTFTINGSERVGIVGRTGSGKSTLVQSLFRVVEPKTFGSICIDGVDICRVSLHDLRSRISIIPQDPALFSGSLRYNLDPMQMYSDVEIWSALGKVELTKFVLSLLSSASSDSKNKNTGNVVLNEPSPLIAPSQALGTFTPGKKKTREGDYRIALDFLVDENGSNFSHGQRQLVCIARALLRNSRIIIFDEATANVDQETDQCIQSAIRSNFKGCTVLTIAHRLETIIDADRVLVLDKGIVSEFDTPANLLGIRVANAVNSNAEERDAKQNSYHHFADMLRGTGEVTCNKLREMVRLGLLDKMKQ